MKAVVFELATGRIRYAIEASEAQVAAQEVAGETGVVEGEGGPRTHWVSGGALQRRPSSGLPDQARVALGAVWSVPGVPSGALVLVDGLEMGEVPGAGFEMRFEEPGEYLVEIRPSFPFLGALCAVDVAP
ncbi:hypothetical protein [Amaricoccus solimangrovi]|uniref:Uncharacterized protein n=1 Tax=Amaricoccus solimangrovi TaxID=2589815 RepID=A0A501WFT3_9RHOB|nr:hypothetical protein [Amaricoccus solimangrovi]TPE47220.1 hypothetical protein FJM51_20410 [Amaricoccus solimangrovi]